MTRARRQVPTVLGLDLSLTSTGWATSLHHYGVIAAPTGWSYQRRWQHIRNAVHRVIAASEQRGRPVVAACIEEMIKAKVVGQSGERHLAGVHGVVRVALLDLRIPELQVHNAKLKVFATGKGHATKDEMRVHLAARGGPNLPGMEDQVDALWLHALGMHLTGAPVLSLPQQNLRAVDALELPAVAA